MEVTPSVAPHSGSLTSKSTCGTFLLFIAFGIASKHHFSFSVSKVLMYTFASKFLAAYFKNSAFSFSKLRKCSFPNGITGNKEIRDPITDANFLMLGDGSLKRFLILIMICSDLSLFVKIIMFSEFLTKPRNSNSWVGFKVCVSCILKPNFISKFTVTSIISRHSPSVFPCK